MKQHILYHKLLIIVNGYSNFGTFWN